MFEDRSTLTEALKNPMTIAAMALDEIQNRLSGNRIIADPNTPFCHLLEFGSSVSAAVMNAMDEKLPIIYPKRAKTMEELYTHMSDFDYLRMYSSPAHSTIRLSFAKDYLINHAVRYNANYSMVVIPGNTVFIVGKHRFGIYYPINILINNYTKSFTVIYDTSRANPLHSLTKNVVDKYDLNYRGVEYIVLDFPIYQFARGVVEESLVSATGFAKKIEYNDKFYAVRIFNYRNGKYLEMAQSQSKLVYDLSNPTALVQVLPDESKVKIIIPQIYFDEGVMGSKLMVEIYTTEGELDIDTSNITGAGVGVIYEASVFEDAKYSDVFKHLPFDNVISLSGTRITGGSNAITVAQLRKRVVDDTLYDKVPISEQELTQLLSDEGFYVSKYRDNVTDRRYYAYRVIRDTNNTIIPSLSSMLSFYDTYAKDGEHSSILYFGADNSVTILPSTLYLYQQDVNSVTPLTDTEVAELTTNGKNVIAEKLNKNQYLKSLYHTRISIDDVYPRADTFDLQTPYVDRILFEEDNTEVSAKMMAFSAEIVHDTLGKYEVYLSVNKSEDLRRAVAEEDVKVYAEVRDSDGKWIGTECTYVSTDDSVYMDTWKFEIPTTYHLTLDNKIGVTYINTEEVYTNPERLISLTPEFHVVFMASTEILGITAESTDSLIAGVPDHVKMGFIGLSRQLLNLSLGTNLNDVIHNNVEASFGNTVYARYATDVPKRYTEDVYKKDENGLLVYTTDDQGNMKLVKEHEVGEIMYDANDRIVLEHEVGDIILDDYNQPIALRPGSKLFYIDMIFIDAKMFFSDRQAELNFQNNIYTAMKGYLNTIREIQDQLLERTNIYFNCVRSTGYAKINRGDGQIYKENIELSFRIVCYVPSYVKQSESIQQSITDMTCSAIEEAINSKTISMLDIFNEVKSKMSDYIDHFDLLGINDDVTLQTFTAIDEDSQPSICRKLELSEDNILTLKKQIDITFIALTDNVKSAETYEE